MTSTAKKISMIAVMASNRVIGKDNQMPWHHSADLKHFKKLTMGKPIIMGRKTFLSIGKALPGRHNIVLTRDKQFHAKDCTVTHTPDDALTHAGKVEEVMIIGGAELYQLFLQQADTLYLTLISHDFEGDTYFPSIKSDEWNEVARQDFPSTESLPHPYSFVTLKRL